MRHFLVMFSFIAATIASASCGSSTSPSGSGSSGSGSGSSAQSLSAVINSVPWTANGTIKATYSPVTTNVSAANLNIVAQDFPLTQTFGFAVGPTLAGTPLTPGTYQVGTTPTNALLTVGLVTTYQAGLTLGSGSVTISTLNTTTKTATGTFNFVLMQTNGVATRTVSNGSFSVTFP